MLEIKNSHNKMRVFYIFFIIVKIKKNNIKNDIHTPNTPILDTIEVKTNNINVLTPNISEYIFNISIINPIFPSKIFLLI